MLVNQLKKVKYLAYMLGTGAKGIKCNYLLKHKGEEAAREYVKVAAQDWSKFTLDIIGITLEVEGIENIPEEPCVFIGNHTSILDIPLIFHTVDRNVGFIAKKELEKTPILGYWIKKTGSIFIDRENPRNAIKSINDGVKNIKNGYSMTIFPEGTRSKTGEVGEFKKGSFKLATKAKVPIVPVSIERASRAYEDTKDFVPTHIRIVYGEPIETKNLSKEEEAALTERVRDIVIKNLSTEKVVVNN